MSIYKRLQAVAVLYAAFLLIFSVLQGVIPGFDFIHVWFHSVILQLLFFGIFWSLAPVLLKILEEGARKKCSNYSKWKTKYGRLHVDD
jgi:hypothetical protein